MEIHYHADTDTLTMRLHKGTSADTQEIAPDVVADFDADGRMIALEFVGKASQQLDLSELRAHGLAFPVVVDPINEIAAG